MNVVVTGANRGIGLEFVKGYLNQGANVYAICRNSCDDLNRTKAKVINHVDLSHCAGIPDALAPLKDVAVDLLINNAGVLGHEGLEDWDPNTIDYQYKVNALGPLLVTQTLLPNLSAGSKVAMITSRMGSLADNSSGGYYGYRMSKAALNMASVSLARDLTPKEIAVTILHPGFVQTEMVNGNGDISPSESVARMMGLIENLTLAQSGLFYHSNGDELPW